MTTAQPTPENPPTEETAVNPYIAGAPVVETRMFFGREDIFEWIEKSLGGQYADHILVVHGQRRVGKTSVLKQLGNRLPKKYVPVFFDFQGRTHTTLDRFLWWLAREIARVLKQERNIDIPLPEKEAFASDPDYFENHFLPELLPALKGSVMLLTFDEFDNLEEEEIKETLARPLVDYLRRLMGTDGLNFIYSIGSSGRKLENMQADYTEFFKTALYRKISFLSKDQTLKLITEPVKGVLEYEKGAVELIYQIGFGHPYFTQLICHELFALHQSTGHKKIREEDVHSILDDVVERGTVNLKFVWDEASDLEKWVLAGLANLDDKPTLNSLADFLRKQRVRFADPDLNSALLHLREKDVLTAENRFVIQLLKIWLVKNRPLDQVRDELTEVNPIANRYIEIGMEFKDTHQYERAIESFQEALEVDADNIQAQTNIALVYLDQKAYDKAVVEFEKSLKMDEEDVAARSGLCESHLALGDSAMKKSRVKDAMTSYQRVLAINNEHTEARQRMAEIHRQRAEKALTDGNDEEALAAFTAALKFTPEDPVLASRVAQVQEEKRAKVIKNLSAKAEKEVAAHNWKQAIAYYEDALKLAPENQELLTKIDQVKEKQKAAQLEAIRTRANQAMQNSKWEQAVGIFNEYLALEPEDKAVQKKMAYAQERLRQSRLDALHTKAKSLTRAEKWDDALAAWKQYLEMNPEDKKDAAKEIEEVKKAQATSKIYLEAQTALTKKNYGRAIELLKGIVVDNENYKDASAMLAQAIELRRTAPKWWQHKWVWGIAGGLVLAGLVFLGVRLFMLTPPPAVKETPTFAVKEAPTVADASTFASNPDATIIIGTTTKVASLDPADTYSPSDWEVIHNISEGLVQLKPGTTDLEPGLATDLGTISPDGLTYTFTLKDGIKFGDGTPLTATVYAAQLNRLLTIGPACPDDVADALAVPFVKSITAPDDKTIIFTLITKTAFFRQILTSAPYVPADPNIFPADKCVLLPIAPIYGVGPWYISQYDPDEQMVFEPNPYYTGDLKPQAKEIIVRFYSDPNTMALAVQSGEIDIAWHDLFPDQLTQLKSVTNLHIGTIPSNRIHFLVLNHTMKPFDDPNVDKAVASAIDRDEIANTVFGGWVVPLYSPVPPGFLGATQAFDKMYASPNLDQAKKYLENSGYSASNPVKLELWSSSPSSQVVKDLYASMMQLIKKQLESTGDIQVDLKTPGAGEGYAIAEGKTIQAGLLGWWPDYPDPSDYLDLLVYNRGDGTNITIPAMGSLNGTPINDKAKDLVALLQQADDETELAKRADLYGQAQDVYADLVVTLPLYCDTEHVVYQSYIQGSTDFATSETLNIGPSGIFNYSLLSKTK